VRLDPGAKLGSYEIVEPLGQGGMGEVYRARDSRLHRDVALKILHPDLTGHDAVARFRREARALGSLCHPNVANVYEFEELNHIAFIVMELVAGLTLADRLARGPLPIAEALPIAGQVAAALEVVHDKGIIHRDLKPANIKITADGVVKVLDFGLAKHREDAASAELQTMTAEHTATGAIIGTAAYMSPEQARGWPVDRRTDIWSFGCVLFEMLAGVRVFGASTQADTIAAVLEREVDWTALPSSTPPSVVRLLRRCLARDAKLRLRDIGDAHLELQDAIKEPATAMAAAGGRHAQRQRAVMLAAVFAAGLGAGAAALWFARPPAPPSSTATRFLVSLPPSAQLAGLDFPSVAMSPDGSRLAFVAGRGTQTQLFVRPLHALEAIPLGGTTNALAPFFSPDGRWLAFFAGGELKKVALSGGAPVTLCEAPVGLGGSWNEKDEIVFAPTTGSGISRVSAFGGRPERVSTLNVDQGEFSHRWPEWLPGGETILYTVGTVGSWNDAQIVAQSLATGKRTVLIQGGSHPRYLPSGHLLYIHNGVMMSTRFDAGAATVSGNATPFLDGVLQSPDGAAQFSVSPAGHAAYIEGAFGEEQRRIVMAGRDGRITPLSAPLRSYQWPRISHDGQRILVTIEGSPPDLWVYDFASSAITQLTFDAAATFAAWTRDGQRAVFTSAKNGPPNIFVMPVNQPGTAERLVASDQMQVAGSWSPDGETLAFVERRPNTGRDILLVSPRQSRVAQVWRSSPNEDSAPRLSPDGRWIAFVSNESGHDEIYVSTLAAPDRLYKISSGGGVEPVWGPGTGELFYRNPEGLMMAPFNGSSPGASRPRMLFKGEFVGGTIDAANYDVMPDGQRFIMIQRQSQAPTTLHVLMNWLDRSRLESAR
jgi:eukaryotic-like serine/threonine-protein kinase